MRVALFILLLFTTVQTNAHGNCYKARIMSPSTFTGNSGEIVQLFDGTTWEIKEAYEDMNVQYPMATICPNKHLLIVRGVKFYVDQNDC